ncbi:MAG TPA: acireductone synthase [Candidatus Angelobacter sp.]|nr:acireductone synthase [Candidatus Angelobacter sp.]
MLGPAVHSTAACGKVAPVAPFDENQVRVLLLDIEGTTTPIDFVTKTLFPYASRKLESFLRENGGNPEIYSLMEELRGQCERELREGLEPPAWRDDSPEERLHSCVACGQWLIARDSKATPLKSLEGKIWQRGYESGELKGEVYADVPGAFERWKRQKRTICIYSSGSALAQRLLFQSTTFGDLTPHISLYFDTRVGAKAEADSYRRIACSFACRPEQFLFITDAVKEVEAARSTGMHVLRCEREAHAVGRAGTGTVIQDFSSVFPA